MVSSAQVKPLIKNFAIVSILILSGVGVYFLGINSSLRNERQLPILRTNISPSPFPSADFYTNQPQKNRRLLLAKEIKGGQIAAYRLNDDWSEDLNSGVFIIVLEAGDEYHPVIFSASSPAFNEGGIFETVGDELWVVNGQTNKIDLYRYEVERKEGNILYISSLTYKDSVSLPKYSVGTIFSLKCEKEKCVVDSAFHQESGCSMELNSTTRQYSNIKCSSTGGEFTPEPL